MATDPVFFVIQIFLPEDFPPQADICLDNGKTKERFLVSKVEEAKMQDNEWDGIVLLISRSPLESTNKWMGNEKEVLNMDFSAKNGMTIYFSKDLKVVAI
jgi:hypothetical protein